MVSFQSVMGPDEAESEATDDPLDVRAAMADWDARFARWQHEEGLKAMRESEDPETRRLGASCNCSFCTPSRSRAREIARDVVRGTRSGGPG